MKILFILPFFFLAISACSTIDFTPKFENHDDERYDKAKYETVNMSEYDKQRYYDQNNLKRPKPINNKNSNK